MAKASKGKSKGGGTHEASQAFFDYAGDDYKHYEVGEDVSHIPAKKLTTLIEAGLVKKSAAKTEVAKGDTKKTDEEKIEVAEGDDE